MAANPHRRRAVRHPGSMPVVTERDLDMLTLVGLSRYVSTDQLARDFFPSTDRARRRVRKLFDAGLLTVMVVDSAKPNLVALTRRGLSLLLAREPGLDGRVGRAGAVRLPAVDHHLAVVDARTFAAGLASRERVPLRFESGVGALAAEFGLPSLPLEPDGIAVFGEAGETTAVGVEVDLGHEGLKVLVAKFERYAQAFDRGPLDALWLVVEAGPGRRTSLEAAVAAAGIAPRTTIVALSHLRRRPVVGLPEAAGEGKKAEGINSPLATHANQAEIKALPHLRLSAVRRADGRGR